MLYDVFICHASEDKEDFVSPLAEELRRSHLEVWYDDFSLRVGDSLREAIDRGLSKSRFGIVILSPSFFQKKWPRRELNGLVAREMNEPHDIILPIWHRVTQQDVVKFSPPLADRSAIDTKLGLKAVCAQLLRKLRPQDSPLIVARDELLHFGITPPVVTDQWWLDVVEASNRIPNWGFVPPENSTWGRWTFPLPESSRDPAERGLRLAWTAMQMSWEKAAQDHPITQITKPERVHDFIFSQPGLVEACHLFPAFLAIYAPQITISGFSGPFEQEFDEMLAASVHLRASRGSKLGQKESSIYCDECFALRHPSFGGHEADLLACYFVQGELNGPSSKFYEIFEYVVWFLSIDSAWLPARTHKYLLDGMKQWSAWPHFKLDHTDPDKKYFQIALWETDSLKALKLTQRFRRGLLLWVEASLRRMQIADDATTIVDKFLELGFIEEFIANKQRTLRKSR